MTPIAATVPVVGLITGLLLLTFGLLTAKLLYGVGWARKPFDYIMLGLIGSLEMLMCVVAFSYIFAALNGWAGGAI